MVRIIAEDSECKSRVEAVSRSLSRISVSTLLAITLAATAAPTAPPPVPATPIARELISELSLADRVTAPTVSISERTPASPLIAARVVLVMTLLVSDSIPAPAPEAATPTVRPRISELFSAARLRVEPLLTVEPEISALTELVMTLAPIRAPAATAPVPATLTPAERISEASSAVRSIAPSIASVVTTDPPEMLDSTELVITLPKPVALTATAPEPATPTVRAIISASESASIITSPAVEVTSEWSIPA